MSLFSRENKSFLGEWWWTVDRPLLISLLILCVFGVVLVTTAGSPVASTVGLSQYHFLIRHIIFLIPTLFFMIGISMLSHKTIWRLGTILLLGTMATMVFVLFFGTEIKGARRWLHVLGFSIQPSEFLKPSFILVSAWLMALHKGALNPHKVFNGSLASAILFGVIVALLVLQPDFGMTVVIALGWCAQVFLAGLPFRFVFILAGAGVAGAYAAYLSLDHVQSRINRFLNPDSGDTFQVQKSIEAFQNGGLTGTGPGQGTVKLHLPDAHADFIFSVVGEEFGLLFLGVLIALYAFIVLRCLNKLMNADNIFNVMAVGGILTIFGLQTLVHMGSALNILPAKGMTLPFISYGGSSLVATGIAMGVVLALTRKQGRFSSGGVGSSLFSKSGAVQQTYE